MDEVGDSLNPSKASAFNHLMLTMATVNYYLLEDVLFCFITLKIRSVLYLIKGMERK